MYVFVGLCISYVKLLDVVKYWIKCLGNWCSKMYWCNFKKCLVFDWLKNKGDKCCVVELVNNVGYFNLYNFD